MSGSNAAAAPEGKSLYSLPGYAPPHSLRSSRHRRACHVVSSRGQAVLMHYVFRTQTAQFLRRPEIVRVVGHRRRRNRLLAKRPKTCPVNESCVWERRTDP
jgi:hypothetical protein